MTKVNMTGTDKTAQYFMP